MGGVVSATGSTGGATGGRVPVGSGSTGVPVAIDSNTPKDGESVIGGNSNSGAISNGYQ